jgi:putative ABC transport system permease protein
MTEANETWLTDLVAAGVGLVAAAALLIVIAGLVLSLPVVCARAAQVLLRREWIPLVYNLRSLARRKLMTLATGFVLALVVFVFTAVSMLALGIQHTLASTGDPRNVKVIRTSALSEWTSWVDEEELKVVATLPGLAPDENGNPLVSGEMVVLIWAARQGAVDPDDGTNLSVRGVHPVAFRVHAVRGLTGQRFEPGTNQIVIGKALRGRFVGAELGGTMTFADRDWKVVGILDHGGTAHDSEIWGDIEIMAPTFRRGYSTATLVLKEPAGFAALSAALSSNTALPDLLAKREVDYWKALSENYVGFVRLLGGVVTVIFSLGAVLGALNTMYAQVSARTRELGTLRAIGFKPRAVLISLVAESVLLSLVAGILGVACAALLSRMTFELTTVQTLSEITYGFHLSPELALGCLGFAVSMGYAGGLLPAFRAAKMPIVEAVRAS